MKKNNFALLALAVLILGSCSQDETLVENPAVNAPIEFGICLGKAAETRAGITTNETIQKADAGFGVYAGYKGIYPNFMLNQQVTYAGSDSWTYDPVKYWPTKQGDYLTFYAYAPYQENPSSGNVIDISSDPEDFYVTYNHQDDLSNNVDFVAASAIKVGYTSENMGNVTFNLKHELTRLSLYAEVKKNGSSESKTKIVITDVKLDYTGADAKFCKSATYKFAQSNAKNAVGTWDEGSDYTDSILDLNSVINYTDLTNNPQTICNKEYKKDDYLNGIFVLENSTPVNLCGGDVIDDTKKYVGNHLFLIPAIPESRDFEKTVTGITATDLNLDVTYEIVTESKCDTVTKTVPITSSSSSNDTLFVQGKAYTFTLIFGVNDVNDVNEVKLGADAVDWAEVDEKLNVDRDTDDKVTP